ncbi:hypothetical protein KAR91_49735 [Candidatus Pacearchaeota archaeon]|nr:hypothetical protein [Candidatus Pacearchaeota archaeon]
MFTIQTIPMGDSGEQVMIVANLTIKTGNKDKVMAALKQLTKMPVGEEWILQHAEKPTTITVAKQNQKTKTEGAEPCETTSA